MNNNDYIAQLQAFFHDPIDKPINIHNHEKRAEEQISQLGLQYNKPSASDHIASAADRIHSYNDNQGNTIQVNFDSEGEITHPLGSGVLKLTDQGDLMINTKNVADNITKYLHDLKDRYNDSYKDIIIRLWREFPEKIKTDELPNYRLGNLWDYLPADTRIPDHSILSHNWLVSAVASCGDNIIFSKFSIGPVQSFISTAKRTEDFWMGSYMLSYLISQTIIYIIDNLGPQHIIFPYVKGQPFIDYHLCDKYQIELYNQSSPDHHKNYKYKIYNSSLSNVVFFICPEKEYKQIIEKIQKYIMEEWDKLCREAQKKFSFNDYAKKIFNEQIGSFLEFNSAGIKIESCNINNFLDTYQKAVGKIMKPKSNYKPNIGTYWDNIYEYLDKVFSSSKLTKKFNYIEEEGRKCTLCGEHSAIAPDEETSNSTSKLKEYWKDHTKNLDSFRIDKDGNDRLCGICLTKRMALESFFKNKYKDLNTDISFPSLMSIASWPFKLKVIENWETYIKSTNYASSNNKKLKDIVEEYNHLIDENAEKVHLPYNIIKKLKDKTKILEGNTDTRMENFMRYDGQWIYIDAIKNNKDIDKKTAGKIISYLKTIYSTIGDRPNKYYAIVSMDGDEMGKWLSATHPKWPKYKDVVHSKMNLNLADKKQLDEKINLSPSLHAFISHTLNNFSLNTVTRIVESDYPGKLVYAGGDDVLAILPFDYALECAEKIRYFFSGNVNKKMEIDLDQKSGYYKIGKDIMATMGDRATMSAGIVYAHYKYSLQSAIKKSKYCEKSAKTLCGRDAYYISILKHSGSEIQLGLKWKINNSRSIDLINNIVKSAENGKLAMNFFSSAHTLLNKLDNSQIDIFKSLLHRDIRDHIVKKKDKDEIYNTIEKSFKPILDNPPENSDRSKKAFLLSLLLCMRFLASKGGKE